jgi:hypothetical protein
MRVVAMPIQVVALFRLDMETGAPRKLLARK